MNVLMSKVVGIFLLFALLVNAYVMITTYYGHVNQETFVKNFELVIQRKSGHRIHNFADSKETSQNIPDHFIEIEPYKNGRAGHNKGVTKQMTGGDSFLNQTENLQGRLNVYYYEDICADYDNYALLWNNLFPNYPDRAKLFTKFEDEKLLLNGQSRRFVGFITPNKTDWYSFQLSARLGVEMILIDDDEFKKNKLYNNFVLRFGVYKPQIVKEMDPKLPEKPFISDSHTVKLFQGRKYLVDITHVVPVYGLLTLKWKTAKQKTYKSIPSSQVFSLYARPKVAYKLPNIKYIKDTTRNTKLLLENPKNFVNIPVLKSPSRLKECDYKPDYVPEKVQTGFGTWYIKVDNIFPHDPLVVDQNKEAKSYALFMDGEKALDVATRYVKENIEQSFKLNRIVHIEENQERRQGKRYFVEIDVTKDGEQRLYRSSGWIFVNNTSSEMCRPKGFHWKREENIYLITPVKNQARWIRYLIESLNEIVERTSEKNLHLVLVDFSSEDCKIEDLLKKCKFPHTLLKQEGAFSKVIGLNKGVNSIQENDALVFVFDLQLQIPDFLFDYIRKHTFKKRTAYVPILCRLYCGQHPQYTNMTKGSIWQEIGYGMISIFKSDWIMIGGMDEEKFGKKWGGEDWDFVERVLVNKIEIIHHRIPGYYHIFHSTKGTWDGTKEF